MFKRIQPYFIITLVILLSTLVLWSPFILKQNHFLWLTLGKKVDMLDLYKHWDGPLYIIVAKTFYYFDELILKRDLLVQNSGYFAAHFPLYPIFIRLSAPILGYLKSMLFWPVVFACFYGWIFYYYVQKLKLSPKPFILTLVALFFLPRFLVVRSVGAPETILLFFLSLSVFLFLEKKYFWASLAGSAAVLTKSSGIFLFIAYGLYFIERFIKEKKIKLSWFSIILLPLTLILLFTFFYIRTGDFWAHFHAADNINLILFPPFQVFNASARWVGTGWLEDVYFLYFFYALAIIKIYQEEKLRPAFYLMLVFFCQTILLVHKDISRYSLPMLPFALIAFEKFFTSKKFLIIFAFLLIPLFFYAVNFMLYNQGPIADWSNFK